MTLKGKRVLVTGGAGFIGSELVRQLSDQAARVTVVDNLANGRRENLQDILGDRVELLVEDVRNQEALSQLLPGVDVVFHLACLGVRHSIHSPVESHEVNATATLNLLMAARNAEVGRFVYVSSSEVYGTARWAPMSEEHPTFPKTAYGAAKLAGECYTRAFHDTYGYSTVVVRPFNAYGPRSHHEGDCGEVIPKFLLRTMAGRPMVVFGDGTQTRDFTYVGDTARGIMMIGTAEEAMGQTVNLGNGRETSIAELTQEIAGAAGNRNATIIHDAPRPGDILRLCADTSLAHRLTGFAPEVSLRDGLTRLKDWYAGLAESAEQLLERETTHNWLPEEKSAWLSPAK